VVQGDKVPEDSRMMEKREAEQVSKKKRKRLGEEKQQEKREERAQEKLDKELIDMEPQQQPGTFGMSQKLLPLLPHLSEWHPVTDTLRGGCSGRMVFRSVAICCWVLSFKTQGDISKLKDNYKVKITGHVKDIGDDATMEGNTQQQIATGFLFSCEFFVSLHWHWHLLVLLWEQDQIFLIYEFLH
jgi:hypothetical protein